MPEVVLVRHGETEWSQSGRHTGRTDLPLTPVGEQQGARVAPLLAKVGIAAAFVSPMERARHTARLAGLDDADVDEDLAEWDYGGYEGRTTAEIQQERPDWNLWRDGVVAGDARHPGESLEHVGARCDRVLERVRRLLDEDSGDVVLVAHGHVLRVLTARWLDLPPRCGALFRLDTATVSKLGFEHGRRVITAWNMPPAP